MNVRQWNWPAIASFLVALAIGIWLGAVGAIRLQPNAEQLWGFAGSAIGAIVAIGGAALLFVFQRHQSDRAEMRAVDELLKQFYEALERSLQASVADDENASRALLNIAIDKIDSTKRILGRSSSTHLGLIHTATSIEILDVGTLRHAAQTSHANWCEVMAPRLTVLVAAAGIVRESLWKPELRAKISDITISVPF